MTIALSSSGFRLPQNVTSDQLSACSAHSTSLTDSSERVSIGTRDTSKVSALRGRLVICLFLFLLLWVSKSWTSWCPLSSSDHTTSQYFTGDMWYLLVVPWLPTSKKGSGYLAPVHGYVSVSGSGSPVRADQLNMLTRELHCKANWADNLELGRQLADSDLEHGLGHDRDGTRVFIVTAQLHRH